METIYAFILTLIIENNLYISTYMITVYTISLIKLLIQTWAIYTNENSQFQKF